MSGGPNERSDGSIVLSSMLQSRPVLAGWIGGIGIAVGLLVALQAERTAHGQVLALGLAAAAVARGVALRRPLLWPNVAASAALLAISVIAANRGYAGFAQVVLVLMGAALLWAPPAPLAGTASERRQIRALVDRTSNDTLAPFAQRLDKSYVFAADGQAAVAYRVRFGVLVVSGDPIGDPASQPAAAQAAIDLALANGWRIGVLGAGEQWTQWWRDRGLTAVPIGRDVVIDIPTFSLVGRAFRNLRQAVQRTHNAGVTTAIHPESELPDALRGELSAIVARSRRNANRGFSMILDGLLDGEHPGSLIAVAYDRDRRVVAFHRFVTADGGREISQDLPWRRPGAPNGVDERLAYDTIAWGRERGALRLSLSFAAFPELYAEQPRGAARRATYWLSHRLDRYVRLESLYRYLRKFHAMGQQRVVLLRLRDLIPVAAAMLTLEFNSYRRTRMLRTEMWRRLTK
ncbi:MAG TPA: phosphatidylglycerol lysyltransferase domain-containing protein [Mycobacteriales bacterium]|nr:phosphatidylglycerol lysyltransferase domain-containing protein [Mycobacteriales bacterium]